MAADNRGFIYWSPRILSILFIIFLAMFSLDVISPELSWGEIIIGLLMHNIPVLLLIILLIAAWKYEIVGFITFVLAGLLYIIISVNAEIPWYLSLFRSMIIAGPAFLIGILFMINWFKKRER